MVASAEPAARRVTLVCGPPCAGKSRYVADHARPGDVVVDYDAIARSMGSPDAWDHPEPIRMLARSRRTDLEDEVARMPSGTAWVIRSLPEGDRRAAMARRLRATDVVVLDVPPEEALRRAAHDRRPSWTESVITSWWRRYTP